MNIQSFRPCTPRRAGTLATMLAALSIATLIVPAQAAPPSSSLHTINPKLLQSIKQVHPKSSTQKGTPVLRAKQPTQAITHTAEHFQLKPDLVSPGVVRFVYQKKTCTMRAGPSPKGPGCGALQDGSNVAMLTWIWAPCSHANCVKHIAGFRIYRSSRASTGNSAHHDALASSGTPMLRAVTPGVRMKSAATAVRFRPAVASVAASQMAFGVTDFHPGDCFVVRAYTTGSNGQPAMQSRDSEPACLKRGTRIGTRVVTLTPKWKQGSYGVSNRPDKAAGCIASRDLVLLASLANLGVLSLHGWWDHPIKIPGVGQDVVVGNHEIYVDRNSCDTNATVYVRSGVYFDLGPLTSLDVLSATLHYQLEQGRWTDGASDPQALPISCAYLVGAAEKDWVDGWSKSDGAIPYMGAFDSFLPATVRLPDYRKRVGAPLQADVTPIVRAWKSGTPNYGFVMAMKHQQDEMHHAQNNLCMSKYGHFRLTVMAPRIL